MRDLFNTDYVVYDKGNDHILRWETSGDMIVFGDKEEAVENCYRNEEAIRCTDLSAHHKKELINQINNRVMNEMEQEKRASLHADVMIRRALDLRTKDNVLIAEFMDLRNTGMSIYEESDYKYHKSWDWLMPVCRKIDEKLSDNRLNLGYFDECLTSNDLEVRFQAVVEFINQLNK
tara:strand:- start:126 stop:653 length:528 start_codon:yes stop_codon:yes gene_type:complete